MQTVVIWAQFLTNKVPLTMFRDYFIPFCFMVLTVIVLDFRFSSLEYDVDSLESEISDLQSSVNDLGRKISDLEDKVSGLELEILFQ